MTQLELQIESKDYSDVNIGRIIGKMAAGLTTIEDSDISYIQQLWALLDEVDQDDGLGSQGWRHRILG